MTVILHLTTIEQILVWVGEKAIAPIVTDDGQINFLISPLFLVTVTVCFLILFIVSSSKKCASEIIVITMRLKSFILNCFFFFNTKSINHLSQQLEDC